MSTRREVDQSNIIRQRQQAVADAYEAVSRGTPGAVDKWNRANRDLGNANQRLWNISAGLAFDDSDEG
jgi:hypothetical protein